MFPIESLLHITFQTGHQRVTRRDEVKPGTLAALRPVLSECERAGSVELPTPDGLMQVRKVRLPSPSPHVGCWALSRPNGPALITQAVSMRKGEGDDLWRLLHAKLGSVSPLFATRSDAPPTEPWLGVSLHLPVLNGEEQDSVLSWLGDFERCLAWAWVDQVLDAYAR